MIDAIERNLPSNINRRKVLFGGLTAAAGILVRSSNPPRGLPVASPGLGALSAVNTGADNPLFTNEEIITRIESWKVPTGEPITVIVPELEPILKALRGTSPDLSVFGISKINVSYIPRLVENSGHIADLNHGGQLNMDKSFYINVDSNLPGYSTDLVEFSGTEVRIDESLQNNDISLILAPKEIQQAIEYPQYAKVYRQLFEQRGGHLDIIDMDPQNHKYHPAFDDLINITLGMSQDSQEVLARKNPPSFSQLVDLGSHFRVGVILYANWGITHPDALNHPEKYKIPQALAVQAEMIKPLLLDQKIIYLKDKVYRWTNGCAPEINSTTFIDLYREYYINNPEYIGYPLD